VRFSTSELAAHLGATVVGPDVSVDGVSIDSRTIRPGQLFVPIVADRDGHAFVPAALEAGAPAYLTADPSLVGPAAIPGAPPRRADATALVVEDTAAALLGLGSLARERVGGVVGITGSVGKTTTKDLLAACLGQTFPTAASERSFNNELGLPLTLLNAADGTRWAVLEMGARGFGHIARLAAVARPDVGIVTSVAMAHTEFLGDLDGVARAKAELVASLPADGVAVLNFDDVRVRRMALESPCPILSCSEHADAGADVQADDVVLGADLRPAFCLRTPWGDEEVRLGLHGVQAVPDALAAAAAALWCGVPLPAVAAGLAGATGSPLRMEVHRLAGGPLLVVDCYNANPASTEAALRSLAAAPAGRRLAVLGVMAELGEASESEHRRAASLARELGVEVVGYGTDLYGPARVDDVDAVVELVRATSPADAVLVKGSRVARLEDVVRALGVNGAVQAAPSGSAQSSGA
jgi:UDP-N-acetylmuramoyl-tripeptide--D-alanyl-D-alanine ligase